MLPFDSDILPFGPEIKTLVRLLESATPVAEQYFQLPIDVEIKPDDTPVTKADRQIEIDMRELLNKYFPDDGIFGEEMGNSGNRERMWVVDPIDGTKSFMHGNPLYGHLVAFSINGVPILGGMNLSALGELWIGVTGQGAWRRKFGSWNRVTTRTNACLQEAALLCTTPDMFNAAEKPVLDAISSETRYVRYGGDCYNYACIAGGWADIAVESEMFPYDFMALTPLIKEAGGEITDWSGKALNIDSGPQVIASGSENIHEAALAVMSR